ncbi:MAG: hypothetical protein IID35_11620 [Planctomycetes bacterium]|nr:hypothetical protein [Planctomycetota bacterium]
MSNCSEQNVDCELARLQRQAQRIRNRLANAWHNGSPMVVIHRLEDALRRRWRKLEKTRQPPD